jgi:hypothetical protein
MVVSDGSSIVVDWDLILGLVSKCVVMKAWTRFWNYFSTSS